MNPLPVSARRLCQRTLRTEDGPIRTAGLFPFFDRDGRVKWVMLLAPDSFEIYLVPWRPLLFRAATWGPIRLAAPFTDLRQIARQDAATLQALWHYDPWWLLDDERYGGHWAVDLLKAMNCAGRLERDVKEAYFRRDLSGLTWVYLSDKGETALTRWKPELLPAGRGPLPEPSQPIVSLTGWRFDPIWTRWTER